MDLSKLPKLSNTQAQQPTAEEPPATATDTQPAQVQHRQPGAYSSPGVGADIWVSVIIGVLLIAIGFTFARFMAAKMSGQPFHTNVNWVQGPNEGTEVAYFDLQGFTAWTDMGVFLFGLVLLFEAAAKAAALLRPGTFSRALLATALLLTIATTILNVYVCIRVFGFGVIPIWSALAVAFGGWIIADEWRMLQSSRPPSAIP